MIVLYLKQDVNLTWHICLGFKKGKIYMKIVKNEPKTGFAARMEWVNNGLIYLVILGKRHLVKPESKKHIYIYTTVKSNINGYC